MALQAEDGVQAALEVGVQQPEGGVAAVVDDASAGAERGEVGPGGPALVAVGVQVEVDRQAGAQWVQPAEQALRVMGRLRWRAVAVVDQRAGGRFSCEPSTAKARWPCHSAAGLSRGAWATTARWNRRNTASSTLARALQIAAAETGRGCGTATSSRRHCSHRSARTVP